MSIGVADLSFEPGIRPATPIGRSLSVGDVVVYPRQGPCRIDRLIKQIVNGTEVMLYHLVVLDEKGGELFIPVDKAHTIGLRKTLSRSEIPALMAELSKRAKSQEDWKQAAADNFRLFSSGSAFDLAELVKSLTESSSRKDLSFKKCEMLAKARSLLVCEISEVMGETRAAAEERLNAALNWPSS
ncbi:MAG TPA: CarD family transcriptional regulator [Blastocatellia bacterium]|nr:CarD family transcriptional regulator [Blastocatellia bacterium]